MCLLDREARNPRSAAFLSLGMIFLVLAVLWPLLFPAMAHGSPAGDFFHGMLYGLSFAFNIGSIVSQRRGRTHPAS